MVHIQRLRHQSFLGPRGREMGLPVEAALPGVLHALRRE